MTLQELYQRIELQPEMVQLLAQAENEMNFAEMEYLLVRHMEC